MNDDDAELRRLLRGALTEEQLAELKRSTLTGIYVPLLPRGRRHNPKLDDRDKAISQHVTLLVANGEPSKNAVGEVAGIYGVGRSTVYAARKKYPPPPKV